MKPRRRLDVRKERLAPLEPGDLGTVAGHQGSISVCETICVHCLNDVTFEWCPIVTLPIEQCL